VIRLTEIWRYPVKSLGGERLARVRLERRGAVPADRRFAFAPTDSPFDPAKPAWQPRRSFLHLARHESIVPFAARWREDAATLTILRGSDQIAEAALADQAACRELARRFGDELGAPGLRLVHVPGVPLSDTPAALLSVISLDSLGDLEAAAGQPVDPRRFRGNLLIEGAPPWQEFGWTDRVLTLGTARLRIVTAIERCAATTVNPDTGVRDLNLPLLLQGYLGRVDCGVFAEVLEAGETAPGDTLSIA
jgi:uncharacterized protein YcbX